MLQPGKAGFDGMSSSRVTAFHAIGVFPAVGSTNTAFTSRSVFDIAQSAAVTRVLVAIAAISSMIASICRAGLQ